ncbi:hypothetical protein [Photorhabdus asymbiotica]|uniref:hypothetical protein n=1 Tax=Photorhabdus asymbiotica TaxID=291112 RepID=UPI003DA6E6B5
MLEPRISVASGNNNVNADSPAVESEISQVGVTNSIITGGSNQIIHAHNERPSAVRAEQPLLRSADGKITAKTKKQAKLRTSNSISNKSKAIAHVGTLTLASVIGIALAPFTAGISLLPTAFVVLFGNASAMAMYGGSQYLLGSPQGNNENKSDIDKPREPLHEPDFHSPNRSARRWSVPVVDGEAQQPDISEIDHSEEVKIDNPESESEKSERIDQDIIDEKARSEDKNDKHQPTLIEQLKEKLKDVPVIKYVEHANEIDQVDFTDQLQELPNSENIINSSDMVAVAQRMIHLENGMKLYIGEVVPLTAESVPATEKQQWPPVKVDYGVKTSQGAISGRGDNHTRGVRHNAPVSEQTPQVASPVPGTASSVEKRQWPPVKVDYGVKTSQGAISGRGDNHTRGVRHNAPVSEQTPQVASPVPGTAPSVEKQQQWPPVKVDYGVKTSQGAISGRGDNHTRGVRHNAPVSEQTPQVASPAPGTASSVEKRQWPPVKVDYGVKTSQGAVSARGDNHTRGVRHNAPASEQTPQVASPAPGTASSVEKRQWPPVKAYYGVKTSQGAVSGRGDNHTRGVRHNAPVSEQTPQVASPAPGTASSVEKRQWPPVKVDYGVKTSQGAVSARGDNHTRGVRHNAPVSEQTPQVASPAPGTASSVEKRQWPPVKVDYGVKTSQGAVSGRGDNHTRGVRHNAPASEQTPQVASPAPGTASSVEKRQWPPVKAYYGVKTSQGAVSARGANYTAGVMNNESEMKQTPQVASPAPGTASSVEKRQWPPVKVDYGVKTSQGAVSARGDNHTRGVRHNAPASEQTPQVASPAPGTASSVEKRQWPPVKAYYGVKTSQGAVSGRGDNHTRGVRHNAPVSEQIPQVASPAPGTASSVEKRQWPPVKVDYGVKTSQGAVSARGDNHTRGVRHNAPVSEQTPQVASPAPGTASSVEKRQWPPVKVDYGVKTSQGAISGRGDNHTRGVRRNAPASEQTPQVASPAPGTASSVEKRQWPPVKAYYGVKTSQGAVSARGANYTAGVMNNESEMKQTPQVASPAPGTASSVEKRQWPPVKVDYGVKTSQGAVSARGDNHTRGVRHNAPASEQTPQVASSTPGSSSVEKQRWPTVKADYGMKTSQGAISGRGDNHTRGVRHNVNVTNTEVGVAEPAIISDQGNNYTDRVRTQGLDPEKVKLFSQSHRDNIGMDKPVNLNIWNQKGETRVVSPFRLKQLNFSHE